MARLFISVPISDAAKRIISKEMLSNAKYQRNGLRWISTGNLHITLKFLGEVPEKQIPLVKNAMEKACLGMDAFSLRLCGSGVFPNLREARVIWIGIQPLNPLQNLTMKLESACAEAGFARERKAFSPHLTLARLSERAPHPEKDQLNQLLSEIAGINTEPFLIDHMSLMQSTLLPQGAVYKQIAIIPL